MYLNDWENSGLSGLLQDFAIEAAALDGCEILLASYTYEDYDGSAYVLFRKDGKLYTVNGSHCSCYGLEGQWEPEPTTVEAELRITNRYRGSGYEDQLRVVLGQLTC